MKKLILLLAMSSFLFIGCGNKKSEDTSKSEEASACSGNGDSSCINKIRSNFKSSGKDIISEQYEGDGIFQIQFIEYGKGTFNAYIRTDCECEIAHLNITRL